VVDFSFLLKGRSLFSDSWAAFKQPGKTLHQFKGALYYKGVSATKKPLGK